MTYDLERFKIAQANTYGGFEQARRELIAGEKTGHWIWYIFPQMKGLGKSLTSEKFGIKSLEEAQAYLKDETLGTRLIDLVNILLVPLQNHSALEIFGYTDAMKFRSSMTLFHLAVEKDKKLMGEEKFRCFENVLERYYAGELDLRTIREKGLITLVRLN